MGEAVLKQIGKPRLCGKIEVGDPAGGIGFEHDIGILIGNRRQPGELTFRRAVLLREGFQVRDLVP